MKTTLENEFIKMNFDSANALMETVWTTTIVMGREQYREVMKLYLEQLQNHRPEKLLIDSTRAEYVLRPEDQDWINMHIYYVLKNTKLTVGLALAYGLLALLTLLQALQGKPLLRAESPKAIPQSISE